jgi:hypothetical protein
LRLGWRGKALSAGFIGTGPAGKATQHAAATATASLVRCAVEHAFAQRQGQAWAVHPHHRLCAGEGEACLQLRPVDPPETPGGIWMGRSLTLHQGRQVSPMPALPSQILKRPGWFLCGGQSLIAAAFAVDDGR